MKARVKATGNIVDVELSHYIGDVAWYITKCHASYSENELEFIDAPEDYWTRLEHRYAGMAMQGMLANENLYQWARTRNYKSLVENAELLAKSLVEKMKEEREG